MALTLGKCSFAYFSISAFSCQSEITRDVRLWAWSLAALCVFSPAVVLRRCRCARQGQCSCSVRCFRCECRAHGFAHASRWCPRCCQPPSCSIVDGCGKRKGQSCRPRCARQASVGHPLPPANYVRRCAARYRVRFVPEWESSPTVMSIAGDIRRQVQPEMAVVSSDLHYRHPELSANLLGRWEEICYQNTTAVPVTSLRQTTPSGHLRTVPTQREPMSRPKSSEKKTECGLRV
jgi:hypothetical protein